MTSLLRAAIGARLHHHSCVQAPPLRTLTVTTLLAQWFPVPGAGSARRAAKSRSGAEAAKPSSAMR